MVLADFLSRYSPRKTQCTIKMDETIHSVHWSNTKLDQLKAETRKDPTLSALITVVGEGWPTKSSELTDALKPYWSIKDYISIDNGILLKGQQIIIPPSLRQDVLRQIHEQCHQGIEKTRLLARQCIFWPNINNDISALVGGCCICNTFVNSQPSEPMYQRDVPSAPWEILGSDLFDFKGRKYLLLGDYYSKFPIVRKLPSET